jgi:hypothetical protein
MNSGVAARIIDAGSPAEFNTTPVECNNHETLERTQLVNAPKRSPSVAFAKDLVAHPMGFTKHSSECISGP